MCGRASETTTSHLLVRVSVLSTQIIPITFTLLLKHERDQKPNYLPTNSIIHFTSHQRPLPSFHPLHLLRTNLSLSRSKVLLILHRTIHNLLDQHSNNRRIRTRSLQALHLANLLGLGPSYNSQAISSGRLDLSGELLVVGANVDAPLLDGEHGLLGRVEAGGAGLEL